MDASNKLEKNSLACEKVFRLAVFNVLGNNMDDHSKNLGFLMDENGNWRFAPAYDLTFSPSRGNYQSLSVSGVYQNIGLKELMNLASYFEITNRKEIIAEVKESFSNWKSVSKELEINTDESSIVEKTIDLKLKNF
jgi:serine/threonine-protein kinase HipA